MPTTERGGKPSSLRYYQDGPPQSVDIGAWRLTVGGLGLRETTLTYEDIRSLPRVRENRRYVCVCNWSYRQNWGGTLLREVLKAADWDGEVGTRYLKQTSIGTAEKGTYQSTIPLGPALERRCLIIDEIDDAPLPMERGFPLRLMDFGLYGYKSVKGLAGIEITKDFELGEWERRAGYALDGEIQPKRYRLSDLRCHHFISSGGEMIDI